ncbi:MAG: hypothetical protein ABI680_00785 [Chthoniobacteraceae bacterium]
MKRHLETPSVQPAPTCWQREAPSACLRVETPAGELHLFPYGQLVTVALAHAEHCETVRIVLANHEVEITGRNLRDLVLALQDFAVKWIRVTPRRYQSLGEVDGGIVSTIVVKKVE